MGCAAGSSKPEVQVTKVNLCTPVVRFRDSIETDDGDWMPDSGPVFRKTTGRDLKWRNSEASDAQNLSAFSLPAGRHSLKALALCSNVVLVPPHVAFAVDWEVGKPHGQIQLPANFNGIVPIAPATPEFFSYYGAILTSQFSTDMVTLKAEHELIEFEYSPNYKEKWVLNPELGPGALGLERHEFAHLECPLDEDSGILLLAKLEGKELQMTGFRIPAYHTIYLAPKVIHSNDHLRNRWRTMLTSFTEREIEQGLDAIDHVLLKKKQADDTLVPADLSFLDAHVMAEYGARASCVFQKASISTKKVEMLSSVEEEAQRRLSVDSLELTERRKLDCAPVENLFFPNVVPTTHATAMMMDPPTVLTPLKPRRKSMEDTLGDAAYKKVLSKLGHRASEAAVQRTSRT
ncbi:unnamed protein product [Cladocopium goreaui]|uniref:Uncharacterized protein LOC106155567 n=1 Tax=Cladocopium goreaui TaxID=2562237 RepID=A0A9P1D4G9_9DINO|nr:unnamed protein product [Cladocopium goreaui]